MSKHFPPEYKSKQLHCPYCGVFAHHGWGPVGTYRNGFVPFEIDQNSVEASICAHCSRPSFWSTGKILYPPTRIFPSANEDLDDDIKKIYEEAADIASRSPRAACALLRLAAEMLLERLVGTGKLDASIKKLVEKGLDVKVQQMLDIVRITGNKAIHPVKIDFDDITDVGTLFDLINLIADALITQPKRIREIYNKIPENSGKAIEERDGKPE